MNFKKGSVWIGLVLAGNVLATLSTTPANATTISEFDKVSKEQQIEFLTVLTVRLKTYYKSKQELAHKAACMDDLMATGNDTGSSNLTTLILDEIDLARKRDSERYQIEDILYGVVEHACKDSAR